MILLLEDFPQCDCCGAHILRAGLCGVCREYWPAAETVPVVVANIIEPDELRD